MGTCFGSCGLPSRKETSLKEELRIAHAALEKMRADPWRTIDDAESAVARWYECKLCLVAPIACVFLPCGHAMSCDACARAVNEAAFRPVCPLCQIPIEGTTNICFA